jgi:hypothetical protein
VAGLAVAALATAQNFLLRLGTEARRNVQIGFLGHNGFALGANESPVLVDSILYPRYGQEYTSSPVEIYPPRWIELNMLPKPAAVIISHEHSDHFHLPSLDRLDKATPVIVGPNMIDTVVDCVERLGLKVTRLPFGEPNCFGSIIITLYPPGEDTVLWESRVSQVYARDYDEPELGGVFLGIDANISGQFIDEVTSGQIPAPRILALSNNAQVTPPGVYGSLDSYRPGGETIRRHRGEGFPGMDILEEMIVFTLDQHPVLRGSHILVCGGGFLKDYEQMGPFPFSEQAELANLARGLVRNLDVKGPLPGDIITAGPEGIQLVGQLAWLGTDHDRFSELRERRDAFLCRQENIPLRCIKPSTLETEQRAMHAIEAELTYLSRVFLLADFGRAMTLTDTPYPFVLKLLYRTQDDISLRFDLAAGNFERCDDLSLDDSARSYPYGIAIHAVDLAAVLTGDLQYWDVVGIAMRTWFEGDALESPVAILYDALGEQVRPDLSCQVYEQQMEYLQRGVLG